MLTLIFSQVTHTSPKTFVAFGDMPYSREDVTRVTELVNYISDTMIPIPVFLIHVGDVKSSRAPCDRETLSTAYNIFQQSKYPLLFTPGDNDWTDCVQDVTSWEPKKALGYIRLNYYADPLQSLGLNPLTVDSQSSEPGFSLYKENQRWSNNDFIFASMHVVGSNNGKYDENQNETEEFRQRDAANRAWLKQTFDMANEPQSAIKGAVVVIHANPWPRRGRSDGFDLWLDELHTQISNFNGPVLLIHGDSHTCRMNSPETPRNPMNDLNNFWRLEVFGDNPIDAIAVNFDPNTPNNPFTFTSVWGNPCEFA